MCISGKFDFESDNDLGRRGLCDDQLISDREEVEKISWSEDGVIIHVNSFYSTMSSGEKGNNMCSRFKVFWRQEFM